MSWKPEFQINDQWYTANSVRLLTEEEARTYAMAALLQPTGWRVSRTTTKPNYSYRNGKLEAIKGRQ